jgi:phosphatidylglycerol:prolipoprotein diacylglycerol transferase
LEIHWLLIGGWALTAVIALLYHLLTQQNYSRVAFTIPVFNLAVYWYGLIIMGGILLGAFVVSGLVNIQAERIVTAVVPAKLRQRPLSKLNLPKNIVEQLQRRKIETVSQLLLAWGVDPALTGLNDAEQTTVAERLQQQSQFDPNWLTAAPWRVWNPDYVWSGLIWTLVLAVIGARLYHVLTPSPSMAALGIESPADYFRNPLMLINLRQGGLGIYGGIAGGALGLLIFTYRNQLPGWGWADLSAVGLALGQAIGRWGNFINQELYGRPTDLPWAIYIDPAHRLPDYAQFTHFHPAFLYESVWNFLSFLALYWLFQRKWRQLHPGDLTALYLIFYAVGRTLVDLVRLDSRTAAVDGLELGLPVATLVSLALAAVMGGWLIWKRRAEQKS